VAAVSPSPFGAGITTCTLAPGVAVPGIVPGQLVTFVVPSQAGRLSGTVVAAGVNGSVK
jgi:hypothetical protein